MRSKHLLVGLLSFWALSIVGSPLAWLCQSEDTIAIALNPAEEESGKTFKLDPLEEKLIVHTSIPFDSGKASPEKDPAFRPTPALSDFIGEILLPPPKRA
ncbi:hypothetical protein [Robiginitalea sp. SC105]|uniref:hypothetical protein n=1 Tax=Robiginitalea sp. SC105 TaxID=2762332 RepID=UPI00163A7E7A|nr:hypothetical protein [Robiginitalea sp. SC105]MBC2838052.1 hypothetical protein [Robiginitalea sp. SC105]